MTTPFDDPKAELAWMFLQYLGSDLDECAGLLSDDFSYWSITTGRAMDKAALRRDVTRNVRGLRMTLDFVRCVVDGDTVVIEAQGNGVTAGGVRYDSPFVFIFDIRDGQIASVREYSDTRLAAEAFGI
ncbi:nuclear transport factor 2 family protein [Mycobacterium sp.]|uniref:nuclear transport factor 2 family protein n=1 Tax=Mycobacterium sp. TaxID=1785 RepID=UPI0031D41C0C